MFQGAYVIINVKYKKNPSPLQKQQKTQNIPKLKIFW